MVLWYLEESAVTHVEELEAGGTRGYRVLYLIFDFWVSL
jgi:hypothetical protein